MKVKNKIVLFLLVNIIFCISCQPSNEDTTMVSIEERDSLTFKMQLELDVAEKDYHSDLENPDNHVWYGRRTAYLGDYKKAIDIYTKAIERFPEDARMYRHRGHRYISSRQFDKAIADFEKAVTLIEGTENEIEPDGMPNALNIPISTLHGNIYYHLGLAYYLQHDYEKAYKAYLNCRNVGKNYDNVVSSTHWLYMIQQRLGDQAAAEKILTPIHPDSTVIENHSYSDLCLFYKKLKTIDDFSMSEDGSPSSDAVTYGLANWYFYNDQKEKAQELLMHLHENGAPSSFGKIAADSDLERYF